MNKQLFSVLSFCALILLAFTASSQDLNDFYERRLGVHVVNTHVSRHAAGVSQSQRPIYTGCITISSFRSKQWGIGFEYNNDFGGDAFLAMFYQLFGAADPASDYWLTNALVGNFNVGVNVYGSKHTVVCAGLDLGDRNVYNTDIPDDKGYSGWHFCAGGFVRVDQQLNKKFALRFRGELCRSYLLALGQAENNVLHPMFLSLGTEVFMKSGFFLSAQYSRDITKFDAHVQRIDYKFGKRFRVGSY